jgi:hypothetical protein
MKKNSWLIVGGIAGVAIILYALTRNSGSSTAAQNAVNPDAQIGAGAYAQGTSPDIGNLLSYNQPTGGSLLIPQATNVDGSAS